ncbi:hypothetical protein COV04_02310 [Candidatus Uhrbacteria bacterium CG10_big_fil_rev_8_21_14_0_10_48_11]|uniref:O-antigen ligase-related domain-containing protein n=1 Tax=Candidatus Uhrbacteria bacterium CG10_big_fil_rev_8_21_14_0_10_48_11 TaxID=1975037 RepID=A0A2M8LEU6_9BACT|nr:MAG: hypothetical protein COV04_02310 [Candidatus Uhrbacteria bacterium CG10_big_fil_rev_8_21_14_0_10_48_11]
MWRKRFFALIIFLLPWQAHYVLLSSTLADTVSSYTAINLYAIDVLLLIAILWSWRSVLFWFQSCARSRTTWRSKVFVAVVGCAVAINLMGSPVLALAVVQAVTLLLFMFFGIALIQENDWRRVRFAFIVSAAVQSLLALTQFFTQSIVGSTFFGMAQQMASHGGTSVIETASERLLRAYGSFPHPNILGGFLALALVATIDWYFVAYENFQAWWNKHGVGNRALYREPEVRNMAATVSLLLGMVVIIFSGLYVTFSRGAALAAGIGVLVYFLHKAWHNRVRASALAFKLGLALMLTMLTWAFIVPGLWTARVTSSTRLDTLSNTSRLAEFAEGEALFLQHPVFGVGIANYIPALLLSKPNEPSYTYQPAHNVLLIVGVELGLVGIVLLAGGVFVNLRKIRQWLERGAVVFVGALSIFLVLASLDHYLWTLHSGLVFWLIAVVLYYPLPSRRHS